MFLCISGGAGFLPSTVGHVFTHIFCEFSSPPFRRKRIQCHHLRGNMVQVTVIRKPPPRGCCKPNDRPAEGQELLDSVDFARRSS